MVEPIGFLSLSLSICPTLFNAWGYLLLHACGSHISLLTQGFQVGELLCRTADVHSQLFNKGAHPSSSAHRPHP